jgi:hypothetical protein
LVAWKAAAIFCILAASEFRVESVLQAGDFQDRTVQNAPNPVFGRKFSGFCSPLLKGRCGCVSRKQNAPGSDSVQKIH